MEVPIEVKLILTYAFIGFALVLATIDANETVTRIIHKICTALLFMGNITIIISIWR